MTNNDLGLAATYDLVFNADVRAKDFLRNDKLNIADNILIADASAQDRLYLYELVELHGALKAKGTESPWANAGGLVRYAINIAGDLVVEPRAGNVGHGGDKDG